MKIERPCSDLSGQHELSAGLLSMRILNLSMAVGVKYGTNIEQMT
jgi:hypothetical protein